MGKFILVRWLEEESLSVIPASTARQGQKVYVGVFGDFKWAGKFYEGEVLSLSGKFIFIASYTNKLSNFKL